MKVTHKVADKADILVVGSIALDTIVSMGSKFKLKDSNPGTIKTHFGGVGHNVYFASHYGLQSPFCDNRKSTRFISIVGDDYNGASMLHKLQESGIDTLGILIGAGATAQYVSNHTADGELVVACADMTIIETDFASHIIEQIRRASPELIVLDCNLSLQVTNKILSFLHTANIKTIIEPTSFAKASRIGRLNLDVFPKNVVDMITPTVAELETIYSSFDSSCKFDDLDHWFPLLDALGIDSQFRNKLDTLSNRHKVLKLLLERGNLQQAFQILPYIPNILIKLGDKGLVAVSLSTSIGDYKSIPTTSPYKPEFIITSQGQTTESGQMGVVIKYFPIPKENEKLEIVNVTGAGDSLLGYLAATLVSRQPNWLNLEIDSVEQEWHQWESIYKAQLASGMALNSEGATTQKIKTIT